MLLAASLSHLLDVKEPQPQSIALFLSDIRIKQSTHQMYYQFATTVKKTADRSDEPPLGFAQTELVSGSVDGLLCSG